MKKKLTDKLFEDFPKLYRGRHLSITENLMPFGFECGNGWYDIIYDLSKAITKLDPKGNTAAVQVKEKFGTLRFYVNQSTDAVNDIINQAEFESSRTCEHCGNHGTLHSDGWCITLCQPCKKRRDHDRSNN